MSRNNLISFCQIPSLNDLDLHSLTSGTLVRFRCMIQDVFDPELYLALFEAKDPASNSTVSTFCTIVFILFYMG